MRSVSRIVVGVQLSVKRPWSAVGLGDSTRAAIEQSLRIAEIRRVPVTLVAALSEPSSGLFGSAEKASAAAVQDQTEASAVLQEIIQQYSKRHSCELDVTATVVFGQPWMEILRVVGGDRDALIVCGTRTRGAISRMLFGNTGLKLVRYAPCPVWLARPREDYDAPLDVMAATDLSETGVEVLHTAVHLGQSLPIRLSVLHVVHTDLDRHMARAGVRDESVREFRRELRESAESTMQSQLAMTDFRTLQFGVQTHVAEGNPDAAILCAIEELKIDLLVMATSRRGGIPGMLFGSTAERLLSQLRCSILVIKPEDFQPPMKLS
ncbi:MAG: universal stress protein [Planctomycetaceae bacterium]